MGTLSEIGYKRLDEEYFEKTEVEGGLPSIDVTTDDGARLSFCGVKHTNDPNSLVVKRVSGEFTGFINNRGGKPIALVVEGFSALEHLSGMSVDAAVGRFGESAAAQKIALDNDVEIVTLEPTKHAEFEHLCEQFPADRVFYFYLARQVAQWHREGKKPSAEEYFGNYADNLSNILEKSASFQDVVGSLDMVRATHREIFGDEINWDDLDFYNKHANPVEDHSVLNEMYAANSRYRDQVLFDGITDLLAKNHDVFCVYGDSHAYSLQKPLGSLDGIRRVSKEKTPSPGGTLGSL